MTRPPYLRPTRLHSLSLRVASLGRSPGAQGFLRLSQIPKLRGNSKSRLQRRLDHSLRRDRAFFELVRRKRWVRENTPSRLRQRLSAKQIADKWRFGLAALAMGLGLCGAAWTGLFVNEQVTLGGVPYSVVHKFWQDKAARDAYFGGDSQALHDSLVALGVEEDVKNFYRDRFETEYELDRYIHQLMYNRTGYVGEAYEVDGYGRLSGRDYSGRDYSGRDS